MNSKEARLIRLVADAICETVAEATDGAPESAIHLAMAEYGITFHTTSALVGTLINAGRLERKNNLLYCAC